jgi:fatty-acyl-CoA synthase
VAAWWVPDEFAFLDEIPKTSVGKFDKKLLRQQLAEDRLPGRRPVENGSESRPPVEGSRQRIGR